MITDFLIGLAQSIVTTVLGWLPAFTLPAFLGTGPGTLAGYISSFVSGVGSLNSWVPVSALTGAATLVAAAFVLSIAVKVARIAASFFTAGGGSAA